MKNTYLIVGVLVLIVIAGLAYKGRHRIKTMLMGSSPTPAAEMAGASPSPVPSPTPAMMEKTDTTSVQTSATKGKYLADGKGMTLYTFDKDKKNVSNCTGGCAQLWLAYTVTTVPATLPTNVGSFKRADGSMQLTWKGMPLYFYSADKKVGDTTGDGFGGLWHIVKQ